MFTEVFQGSDLGRYRKSEPSTATSDLPFVGGGGRETVKGIEKAGQGDRAPQYSGREPSRPKKDHG